MDVPWSLAHTLRDISHCIFADSKQYVIENALRVTSQGRYGVRDGGVEVMIDKDSASSVFVQVFHQLHGQHPSVLRYDSHAFKVYYKNSPAEDAGGTLS